MRLNICRSTFATLIEVYPKQEFWLQQPFLQVTKNVDIGNKKKSFGAIQEDYAVDDLSKRCFGYSKMQF